MGIARERLSAWWRHAVDTVSCWLFGEPVPRPAALWRLRSWNDGSHWIVYLWHGDDFYGPGIGDSLHEAASQAIGEARLHLRRRRRALKLVENPGDSRGILRH